MSESAMLKFRLANLESSLVQKQKLIDEYKHIEEQADSKIKGMQKIHGQKIKSLLNSIQILKKQKASIEGLSKQHKRSKLIEQLNKEINDQDLVIEILRKFVYEKEGKDKGRNVCDKIIVDALNKGPERIRPLTREELRMEIQKLKEVNFNWQRKFKQGDKKKNGQTRAELDGTQSRISSISSSESHVQQNKTEELLNKIRAFQLQTQNLKLQSNSKNKIIEKLKVSVLQGEKYKSQVELLKNEIDISGRKLFAYEKILKESKESMNKKIIDLYERELKVEELQMNGQQKSDNLKSLNEKHSLILQEFFAEKQELQAKYDELKHQNQKIILENISNKKHQENQKSKIDEIRSINQQQKENLSAKLKDYENAVQKFLEQNQELKKKCVDMETKVFSERAQWIQERQNLINELQDFRVNKAQSEKIVNLMEQIDRLRDQNKKLQSVFSTGGSGTNQGGSDKLLLERLQNYKRKVEYYQNLLGKGNRTKQIQIYNELFDKYNKLSEQYSEYKKREHLPSTAGLKNKQKLRKQIIQLTMKQHQDYEAFSSGIDSLNLADVDSEILDNFNTSYEYSIHVDMNGKETKIPKVSQADKELLKLINSDLWYFVKDDQLAKKIEEVSICAQDGQQNDLSEKIYTSEQMRKLKNMSHPQGKKIKIYEEQIRRIEQMNDDVSITSAMLKQINAYDSDVNIEFAKVNKDAPNYLNYDRMKNMGLDIGSDVMVSSVQSGESNIKRKKKAPLEKASKIKIGSKLSINSSQVDSQLSEDLLNSDVSSVNISERQLNRIDSDVQTDFRKRKAK